jgi:methionyl-tRNA synthetase
MTLPATDRRHRFAITTPLYYVNDVPHIGHAYTTMAADTLARYYRLRGYDVLTITGTDEHGQKIERTAREKGIEPQVYCDRIAREFQNLWDRLGIRYDRFIRTTDDRHQPIVNAFFNRVFSKGDIYADRQQGWYCVACEEYKEERELLPDNYCSLHPNKQVEWKDEMNYFFRLSKYEDRLRELYEKNPEFIQPIARRNEILSFVDRGLQDFSISRVNVSWGFALPNDPSHTIYVWFDALLGYISALVEAGEESNLETALSHYWPIDLHLIGKDILRFHAIYWPAMLMSAELPLPPRVYGHGFFTKDGQKISKSTGNTIDPGDLVDRYGPEALRYYFLKEIKFGQDGDFNETRFIEAANADLANGLGNLLNRTLGMVKKYYNGTLPEFDIASIPADNPLKQIGSTLADRVAAAYESLAFSSACEEIGTLIQAGNKYIDDRAPWTLYKQGDNAALVEVLYSVLESVRLSTYLLSPIIPQLSTEAHRQLGLADNLTQFPGTDLPLFQDRAIWGYLDPATKLSQGQPIFGKLELSS